MALDFELHEYTADGTGAGTNVATSGIKYGGSSTSPTLDPAADPLVASTSTTVRSIKKNHRGRFISSTNNYTVSSVSVTRGGTDLSGTGIASSVLFVIGNTFQTLNTTAISGSPDMDTSAKSFLVGEGGSAPSASTVTLTGSSSEVGYTQYLSTQIQIGTSSNTGASGITYTFQYTVTS